MDEYSRIMKVIFEPISVRFRAGTPINQAKMGLNLSRTNSVKYYTSNRISSLIGNGLMTFIDIKTQLDDFFYNDEVIFYKNIDDLIINNLWYWLKRYEKNT